MRKPEIQSLVTLVGGCGEIVHPLIFSHSIPLGSSSLVPPDVVDLSQDVDTDVAQTQREKSTVAALIARCVIGSVDIRCDDTGGLDEHVV